MLKKQFFLIATILFVVASCKQPDSVVGLNVQPPSDKLNFANFDTLTLQTRTVVDTFLRSDNVLNLLGSYKSTVFGRTDASIYSQVTLATTPAFGTSTDTLFADSLVLRLAYSGYYGDTTTALTVHVYQLATSMNLDSPYYNNSTFAHDTDLADLTFSPNPTTYLSEYGNVIVPQLRINLKKALATAILQQNNLTALSSNDAWTQFFKGIYLTVDPISTPQKGCICYFNMASLDSKMTLYFHNGVNGASQFYDFQFIGERTNYQTHDYTGTLVASQLADSSSGNDVNYIAGASGVKVKIKIPNLKKVIQKGNIAVNRAELIIQRKSVSTETLSPPSPIWVQEIDSAGGGAAYIPDQFEAGGFYGGLYDSTNTQYVFNITHYIQDIFKGTVLNSGLYLGVSGASVLQYYGVIQAGNVVVGSGQNPDPALRMRLKIYYTKLY